MLTIKLICCGRMKEKFYIEAYNEYAKRLKSFCRLELKELQESSPEKEAALFEKSEGRGAFVIAMAIEGKAVSSEEFAKIIGELPNRGISEIDFLVGGSNGLAEEIKNRADLKISMSEMTFPHHLARVMLAEQIYRAFKINEGSSYHK